MELWYNAYNTGGIRGVVAQLVWQHRQELATRGGYCVQTPSVGMADGIVERRYTTPIDRAFV